MNALFFTCGLIEYIGRKQKQRRSVVVKYMVNIPVLMSMLSGNQETDWQLYRIQEISPI